MIKLNPSLGAADAAQQYFHTYRIPADKEEIALREYDLSVQSLSGDQRSIALATGLTVVSVSLLATIVGSDNGMKAVSDLLSKADRYAEAAVYGVILGVSLIALRYFAELQKSATHAARKIVVLRRLLGVDYGNIEKVLPTGTLEGANEPYALAIFPGWGAISSLASLLVAPFAAFLILILAGAFSTIPTSISTEVRAELPNGDLASLALWFVSTLGLLVAFRLWLLEKWESRRFLFGKFVGHILNCPFKDRMGHVLYRMELSAFEAKRVGIDLAKFHVYLIAIEDRRFKNHRGNDWLAVLRAIWQRLRYRFVSGGSTIHQQLFRSNCLRKIERRWTRKIVEWIMAPWLDQRYEKKQILDMYLGSVRFDVGVIGLPAAASYFFGMYFNSTTKWSPSPAQIVFLIERLSNVTQSVPVKRLKAITSALTAFELLSHADLKEIEELYKDLIGQGFIRGDPKEIVLI